MLAFCWFSTRRPPPDCDLARSGWYRLGAPGAAETGPLPDDCAILADHRFLVTAQRLTIAAAPPAARARTLMLGVEGGAERARFLAAGFGDVLPPGADIVEVEQRALRLLRRGEQAVLFRRAGPVLLDLALRDAWSEGRRLALHPTEFALLWRLAEVPGQPVTRAQLFRDVWRIAFDPGTNRIEVHVSRLRRKLAAAGAGGLVETVEGGYRAVPVLVPARKLGSGPVPRIARTGIVTRGAALP